MRETADMLNAVQKSQPEELLCENKGGAQGLQKPGAPLTASH